jgi:hypothetical protein
MPIISLEINAHVNALHTEQQKLWYNIQEAYSRSLARWSSVKVGRDLCF